MPFPLHPIPTLDYLEVPTTQMGQLFGYPLANPIGAAACAVTTARGIQQLAQLGFDVLTYKTIRSHSKPSHSMPNIVYLDTAHSPLTPEEIGTKIQCCAHPPATATQITISNSLGNPSLGPEEIVRDIAFAKQALRTGQVLIVSVYGEYQAHRSLIDDFIYTAQLAESAGADVIELNLSCPNLSHSEKRLYQDSTDVYTVTQAVVRAVHKPVIAKIGWLSDITQLTQLLTAAARGGAAGIAAINSVEMQVINATGQPAFGPRIRSGVSGTLIRSLALKFIEQLADINHRQKLDLTLLGMGGITHASHFTDFHQAGAQIALSATGMMWNPYLAVQYHQLLPLRTS